MKKTLLLFTILFGSITAFAQGLSLKYEEYESSGSLNGDDFGKVDNMIYNTGETAVNLTWVRTSMDLPQGWISQHCDDNLCHSELVTTADYSVNLQPGDSILSTAYIYTDDETPGSGSVTYLIHAQGRDSADYNASYTLSYSAFAVNVNETPEPEISAYPVPFNNRLTIQHSNVSESGIIKVYSLTGREIITVPMDYSSGQTFIETSAWNPGNYIVQVFNQSGRNLKTLKAIKR